MAGVYISYPFCAQKCTYCNFASGVFPRELEARYLDALMAELKAHVWEWRPETVYLGGGTPGNMPLEALRCVLELVPGGARFSVPPRPSGCGNRDRHAEACRSTLKRAPQPWLEATIEAAPGTVTSELARGWVECGINRVSLGVQSFVEREIRRTGRKHTAETVASEIRVLNEAGIRNYNIDLIAGLSGQTEASWRESLDWAERLAPPHVSVYMLEVDEDSRLGKELLLGGTRYGAAEAPDEDAVAAFYETAVERLAAMGIARYEISNFARPGFESRHNLKYWKLEPYAGFGADAHSFDGARRWQNPETVEEYVGHVSNGPSVQAEACPTERFFVGLRLMEGIRPAPDEWRRFAEPIRRHVDAGLLETEDGVLRLTSRGVLLSNEVFQDFLDL